MTTLPIRVLVVDDSSLARRIISDSLAPFSDIQIVGTAIDPYVARDKILELNPDVITLDIEMPRMDGITFLKLIMKHKPRPVIIMSSLTGPGSRKVLEALQAGAVDVIGKPGGSFSAHGNGAQLAAKIRAAARARVRGGTECAGVTLERRREPSGKVLAPPLNSRSLILLGASTGGTEALKLVLTSMSGNLPCICVVQHIPGYFSRAFADRLNQLCQVEVREAAQGDRTQPGLALIAPGGYHMLLKWEGGFYTVKLTEGPPLHHQRPAVDVLFDSVVKAGGAPDSAAALLTGMGADGASGLLHLRQGGAFTIAQNEDTCVVYGMPREAVALGAAQQVLPLRQIGPRLQEHAFRLGGTRLAATPV